jgi:hypothetical protein
VDMDPGLLQEMDRIGEQYTLLHDDLERLWADKMVFTWHWWLDISLAVLPWILWIIVRDKKNTHSLLYAGLFTMLAATILCMIGVSQSGWNYNTLLLPYFPEYLPWDLTVMPVTAMLFYQFLPRINPWIKGAVFGVVAAYVVEPIFIWLGFYEPSNWEHHYSLPIYFAIYMVGYWMYMKNRKQACRDTPGEIR